MIQTIEAIVDERGAVRLLEPLHLDRRHRALVTILADEPSEANETVLLSEASLAEDWNRPEEDAAWSHLQHVLEAGVLRAASPKKLWMKPSQLFNEVSEDNGRRGENVVTQNPNMFWTDGNLLV